MFLIYVIYRTGAVLEGIVTMIVPLITHLYQIKKSKANFLFFIDFVITLDYIKL